MLLLPPWLNRNPVKSSGPHTAVFLGSSSSMSWSSVFAPLLRCVSRLPTSGISTFVSLITSVTAWRSWRSLLWLSCCLPYDFFLLSSRISKDETTLCWTPGETPLDSSTFPRVLLALFSVSSSTFWRPFCISWLALFAPRVDFIAFFAPLLRFFFLALTRLTFSALLFSPPFSSPSLPLIIKVSSCCCGEPWLGTGTWFYERRNHVKKKKTQQNDMRYCTVDPHLKIRKK